MEARYHLLGDYSALVDPREVEMSRVTAPVDSLTNVQQVAGTINCAGCKLRLGYPSGATVVKCPRCASITATQSISRTVCPFCRKEAMYPSKETVLNCTCGMSFRVS